MNILKPISKKAVPERGRGRGRQSAYTSVLSQVESLKDTQVLPVDFSTVKVAKVAFAALAFKIKRESLPIVVSRREKVIYLAKAEAEVAEVVSAPRRSRK